MKTFKQLMKETGQSKPTTTILTKVQFVDFLNWTPSEFLRVTERENELVIQFMEDTNKPKKKR